MFKILPASPPVVVVRPRAGSYGHQVLEFLMGLYLARRLQGSVVFESNGPLVNPVFFELECAEVPVLRGRQAAQVLALARRRARRDWWRTSLAPVRQWGERSVLSWLTREASRSERARRWRKRYKGYLAKQAVPSGPPDFLGLDFRRCYARDPLTFSLPAALASRAAEEARGVGLCADDPFVTLHVRESGFKGAAAESPADRDRNARIEDYGAALDAVAAQGLRVVRIGDRASTPVDHPAVVDLATSSRRSHLLEVWALLRSRLFIAGDSGPFVTGYLTGVPSVAVNVTNVLGGYPIHTRDRYLLKRAVEVRSGRRLSLLEMLTTDYFLSRRDQARYRLEDNLPVEIAEGVREGLSLLGQQRVEPTPDQEAFHEQAAKLYADPIVAATRTRKGEPADQLLGDGRIGAAFAARYLRSS